MPTTSAIAVGRPYFLQIVSHGVSLRCVCAERFYAPPPGESKGSVRRIGKMPIRIAPMGKILACGMRYSAHSTMQACSRVAVAYGWKLPSGMPLMTPARCSARTAGRA